MTWPSDGEPRYVVSSLTGYTMADGSTGRQSGYTMTTNWGVYDRAFCHREVRMFTRPGRGNSERLAREFAASLNG